VPSEILNVVVSVLCRITFDFAVWNENQIPITIVCEEAHRYAPRDKDAGFEPVKRALSRIAKEGRKYGVSLCVVSQRPSDLAPSLLSECNTLFALRMTNQDDQDIIRGALPEASHGLMKFLPALRNGEAIVVGEGVSMPMRICFSPLPDDCRPRKRDRLFHTSAWAQDFRRPVRGRADDRALAPRRPARGLVRNLGYRAKFFGRRRIVAEEFQIGGDLFEQHIGADLVRAAAPGCRLEQWRHLLL